MESEHSMARVDKVGSGIGIDDMVFLLLENLSVETVRKSASNALRRVNKRLVVARGSYNGRGEVRSGIGGLGIR